MRWPELRRAAPDIILAMPCGYDLGRTRREMSPLTSHPEWDRLRAVREGNVALADGHQFFNRPGPRLLESLEILTEILHPAAFPSTHKGTGWEPL